MCYELLSSRTIDRPPSVTFPIAAKRLVGALIFLVLSAHFTEIVNAQVPDEGIGVVALVNPDTTLSRGSEARVPLVGEVVLLDDQVRTDASGQVHLMLIDKSSFTVGPNSEVTIDRFVYDPATRVGDMALSAARGVMRFVGGDLSKSNPVEIRTSIGTLGIRGGIGLFSISPGGGITAVFSFGTSLTFTDVQGGFSETVTRAGFLMQISPLGVVGPVVPATPEVINGILGALEGGPIGGNGGPPDEGGAFGPDGGPAPFGPDAAFDEETGLPLGENEVVLIDDETGEVVVLTGEEADAFLDELFFALETSSDEFFNDGGGEFGFSFDEEAFLNEFFSDEFFDQDSFFEISEDAFSGGFIDFFNGTVSNLDVLVTLNAGGDNITVGVGAVIGAFLGTNGASTIFEEISVLAGQSATVTITNDGIYDIILAPGDPNAVPNGETLNVDVGGVTQALQVSADGSTTSVGTFNVDPTGTVTNCTVDANTGLPANINC